MNSQNKNNDCNNDLVKIINLEIIEPHYDFVSAMSVQQYSAYNRVDPKQFEYFNYIEPYSHSNISEDGINMFSFALNPSEHQPSGTCNFSKIDTLQMYAINYNMLRIMSGAAGLAYSS